MSISVSTGLIHNLDDNREKLSPYHSVKVWQFIPTILIGFCPNQTRDLSPVESPCRRCQRHVHVTTIHQSQSTSRNTWQQPLITIYQQVHVHMTTSTQSGICQHTCTCALHDHYLPIGIDQQEQVKLIHQSYHPVQVAANQKQHLVPMSTTCNWANKIFPQKSNTLQCTYVYMY